jgi:succinate dehydrogenase/fumarate reductase flavoprotein subunit
MSAPTCQTLHNHSDRDGHLEFDVIVAGSGASGLTAALVAARRGLSVALLEKARHIGGTSALSGGGLWIPCNHHMPEAGRLDDREAAERYLGHVLGQDANTPQIAAFLESAPDMVRYLEEIGAASFVPTRLPDYQSELPGAAKGRSLLTAEYDGRRLGAWLRALKSPLPALCLFGSMQIDQMHTGRYTNALKKWSDFHFVAGRMACFIKDRLLWGKGTKLANGNALVGRLLHAALDEGVCIFRETGVSQLLVDDAGVSGVVASRQDRLVPFHARQAVVLATGGFGANEEMVSKYVPMPHAHRAISAEGCQGDGVDLGLRAGGRMAAPNRSNGIWAPVSTLERPGKGKARMYPHFGIDRAKPGSIIIGSDGCRFANEAAPYQQFVEAMHDSGNEVAWLIGDRSFLRTYGMGMAFPAPMPVGRYLRNGYLIKASTLSELASKLNVDRDSLQKTVAEFNAFASDGSDPFFRRGESAHDRSLGDRQVRPNPNLGPIGPGPYYALELRPGSVSMILGLETNTNSQLLDHAGSPIRGLYVIGLDHNSPFRGSYPGAGSGLGPAMTFAYRAALHIAASAGCDEPSGKARAGSR